MEASRKDGPREDPFDPDYLRRVLDEAFGPMIDHWFRPRLLGAQRLPSRGPAIIAANHSGSAFPYDAMVLDAVLWRREGMKRESKLRSVYEKQLALTWWMRPFGLDDFWRRAGGVDMTFDNFSRLLARGERVGYYPEGVPGIGKGFQRRYRLQRFHSSFVTLALLHDAPVVPAYIINAEWVIPFNFTFRPLDRLMNRLFNVPFLPLPGGLFAITFPWAWYLALPARMIFVIGEPIDVRKLAVDEGETDFERPDRDRVRAIAERLRGKMQAELDRHVARYGRWPYQTRSLWRELRHARRRKRLGQVLPTGWAAAFTRLERDVQRPAARNRFTRWLRDWDLVGYYLPFGWPLLSLARALRRPPCGYRGLTRDERRRREGSRVWHLAERPLPPRA